MELSSPPAAAAASLVRHSVLRWRASQSARTKDDSTTGPMVFQGVTDCAAQLAELCQVEPEPARAFGAPWFVLHLGGEERVAPALPLVARPGEQVADDAAYHSLSTTIHRESAGRPSPFISWGKAPEVAEDSDSAPFELLWFGDAERYILRGSRLEISDLHSRLELGATPALLDRLLLRAGRLPASVLDGCNLTGQPSQAAVMLVHRHRSLFASVDLVDVASFLAPRANGGYSASTKGLFRLRLDGGHQLTLRATSVATGWTLTRVDGQWPYQRLTLFCDGDWVGLRAELHPLVNPLAAGMRGRLSFDLLADLVAWGRDG